MAFVKPVAQKNSGLISIEATIKIDLGKTSKQVRNATAKALETGIATVVRAAVEQCFACGEACWGGWRWDASR